MSRTTWPAYRASLASHTVTVEGWFVAGHLVRCTLTATDLGFIWPSGSAARQVWKWRTCDQSGEGSSVEAAIHQLREVADFGTPRRPVVIVPEGPPPVRRGRGRPRKVNPPPPKPVAAERRIVWDQSDTPGDLALAIEAHPWRRR